MSDRPLKIWCVSDGRTGIARQCTAIANALSEFVPIDVIDMVVTPRGPQVWLPPQFWFYPLAALPSTQAERFKPPWPDIWIANGRRSIAYSLWLKRIAKAPSFVVQLQNPRLSSQNFDLVVPPRHDRVAGRNIVETLGAPVWFTRAQISRAVEQCRLPSFQSGPTILVVLGGPSKRHDFPESAARAILRDLTELTNNGARLLITTSRRTPRAIVNMFRLEAGHMSNARFYDNDGQDGPNPYLAWLAQADCALVTEDSTNMMTDAAFFGLPIHMLKLSGTDQRIERMHANFIEAGAAIWFTGQVENWTYPPIRDAKNVAEAILAEMDKRN